MKNIDNRIQQRITHLVQTIGSRMSGTEGNRMALEYIRREMEASGAAIETQEYSCPAWTCDQITLQQAGKNLLAYPNPFSPSCQSASQPVFVSTILELEQVNLKGKISVLMGDLTSQVIACKSWFLIEERDKRILELLEQKQPAAILTVQIEPGSINRILEDWEFLIPSATIPPETALALLEHPLEVVKLNMVTHQQPGTSANLVARIPGQTDEWICLMAHHDTKIDTPGAIDNGTGVVILLELLDYFQRNSLPIGLEFIIFGGEEYLPIGDDEYMRRAGEAYLNKVKYAINFDGCAHRLGSDSLACIAGSADFSAQVEEIRIQQGRILASDPWPESNHSTFTFRGVPALAYTSHSARKYVHQMDDSLRWVDEAKMEEIVALTIRMITMTCSQPIDWFRAESPFGQ